MTTGPDPSAVTNALEAQGLKVKFDESNQFWMMSFTINAMNHPAMLMVLPRNSYFLAVAPITSDRVRAPLSQLSAEVLRAIFRAQAETELAKFHVVNEADSIYAAISECSTDQWTGEKLVRRLYACADLAAKIRAVLLELSTRGPAADGG